jgi:5-methyltetrahydropteroyltriglutamate--homocysteine methyltransferase
VMWAKFEALAEGARLASKDLWPKGKRTRRSRSARKRKAKKRR